MRQSILVTSVSGSGKTTTCKSLNELGYKAYDIEDVRSLFTWRDDKTEELIENYHDGAELAKGAIPVSAEEGPEYVARLVVAAVLPASKLV